MSLSYLYNDNRVIDCPSFKEHGAFRWEDFAPGNAVQKIVLGVLGDDAKKAPLALPAFPPGFSFAASFPNLTHLYLWNCTGFATLPALPAGLQCLDVRGCAELTGLPALPATLDTLDLGDCAKLTRLPATTLPKLERFYFNGCAALKPHTLGSFLECNAAAPLVEIDGSGAPAVASLADFPKAKLRKLVLKGCAKLADATGLADFIALDHLNLAGCTALKSLPNLPPNLRYLELFGAAKLTDFMGQSLAPSELGTESGLRQNVAKAFKTLKKFGGSLAVMPHAKLLLLGDGRVGKTTLAKRLIWNELSAAERQRPENANLRPMLGQLFTNSVEFLRWPTQLALPAGSETSSTGGEIGGDVRIWDFGGQEIYHRTHRIFAGEGSVFLVVWCGHSLTTMERPPGVLLSEQVWREVNAPKLLDYWFDYVATMQLAGREKPEFALVCTLPHDSAKAEDKPVWEKRAPKFAASGKDSPEVFFIDTLDDRCGESGDYQRLLRWIRRACGKQAVTIGLKKPRFYRAVAGLVDGWLAENSRHRTKGGTPPILLRDAAQWSDDITALHHREFPGSAIAPDADDIRAITDYLHDTGHIFRLRSAGGDVVLVDQQWAAGVIYSLLDIQKPLWPLVRNNGGWFTRLQLEAQPGWAELKDDTQRERILAYMLECGTVVQLAAAEKSATGKEVFLATDKWLLPPYVDVKREIDEEAARIVAQPGATTFEKFEFESVELNEFDFRRVQVQLAREFGTGAIYFREGVFAHRAPEWCFLVTWGPKDQTPRPPGAPEPHLGYLDGRLIARAEDAAKLAERITEVFYAGGGPLEKQRREPKRMSATDYDLRQLRIALRPDALQAGLSSCGMDKAEALEIYGVLSGFGVEFYAAKRPESARLGVFDYMKQMVSQPCIVLLLSENFVRFDPDSWHCAWELADAVRRLADGRRRVEQTIVIYKNSEATGDWKGFHSRNAADRIRDLFVEFRDYFEKKYRSFPLAEMEAHRDDYEFALHFDKALAGCATFFSTRTTKGSYLRAEPPGKDATYVEVVSAMKAALGEKSES